MCQYFSHWNIKLTWFVINIIDLLSSIAFLYFQRLAGATLLIFANKQDLPGALSAEDIKEVCYY